MKFNDLMLGSKGPGLIGLVLAIFIMIGFGILMLFATDERLLGGEQTIESIIAQQQRDIDDYKTTLAELNQTLGILPSIKAKEKELESALREKRLALRKLDDIKSYITSVNDSINQKTSEFDQYKDKYRTFIRTEAKGQTLPRLETQDGMVYENVTITNINAIGMQITHDSGGKRIAFEKLPQEFQDRFQFDPKQKATLLADEKAQQQAHEANVNAALAAAKEQTNQQREENAIKLKADTIAAIKLKESWIVSMATEIAELEQAINLETRKRMSNAPQMRVKLAEQKRKFAALQADLAQLKSSL